MDTVWPVGVLSLPPKIFDKLRGIYILKVLYICRKMLKNNISIWDRHTNKYNDIAFCFDFSVYDQIFHNTKRADAKMSVL